MIFTPRLTAPSEDNLYYIKTTHGGYNKCVVIDPVTGSVLPDCTGYAWGRYIEEQGLTDCNLSRGNAENWYGYNDGYERGSKPKLGAIICYADGGISGLGHLGVVEEITKINGVITSITISESAYQGFRFRTKTLNAPLYSYGTYVFQGFIYPDTQFDPEPNIIKRNKFNWVLFGRRKKY